jgi:hypothetical protein
MNPMTWLFRLTQRGRRRLHRLLYTDVTLHRPPLSHLAAEPEHVPLVVQHCPVARRYLGFLGPLAWDRVPIRDRTQPPPIAPLPYTPFLAACLVKVDQQIRSMARLRLYLVDHPALTWTLGFPLVASSASPWGFDVEASLPTHRHFTRMLRTIPNAVLQTLLDSTVTLLHDALPPDIPFGQAISLDTKHILAWVKENNPKAYLTGDERYDKTRQPAGDPDCRLGCKKRRNQRTAASEPPSPPLENPAPASTVKVGEWYWGYATGVVATKVPDWGEFVLAEATQPFNCSDVSYFFPLMKATTRRLGFHPRYGAFDAAFDAWYVHADFHADDHDGFAAVPFADRGSHVTQTFDPAGRPLCQAGLAMPLKSTFWCRTALIAHEKGRYACPLRFPDATGRPCPITRTTWAKGGCITTMPTSIGARLRHQLDRDSPAYKEVYTHRTATERINSQAVELGIERPKLRNGQAIANQNTLIYIVINLRALHRVRHQILAGTSPSGSVSQPS